MTILSDENVLNTAQSEGDWNTNGFDSPKLNNSSSTFPIYREGTGCMDFPLKKGVNDGRTYDGITATDFTNKVLVFWINLSGADIDNIPIDEFWVQLSSASNFTSNYGRWDALAQVKNLDLFGWTPVYVYPTNADQTSGTPNYTSVVSYGLVASTGNSNDGKQGGFDQIVLLSYIGGHSQTVALSDIYDHSVANDHGVIFRFGDFYRSVVSIRLGGGTTANTIFNHSNVAIFFDNVQPEQNLGFIFADNTTGQNQFTMADSSISWNEQTGTTPQVFTDPQHCDIFRVSGNTFARGGALTLPAWSSDADTYFTNNVIDNCDQIDAADILFAGNTIRNARDPNGGLLIDASGTSRMSKVSFVSGGSGHALYITAIGTYSLSDFTYAGYGADSTTDAVVYNNSGGAVTLNIVGGNTPTVRNGTDASTVVNNAVDISLTGLVPGSRVYIRDMTNGVNLFNQIEATATFSESVNHVGDIVLRIRVRNASGSPKYKPVEVTETLSASGLSRSINQVLDE